VSAWRETASKRWTDFIERPRVRTLRTRYARQIAFVLARLSPKEFLGLHLTIGVLVLVIATIAFSSIAEDVARNDAIVQTDLAVATWLHGHVTPSLFALLMLVTNMHSPLGVTIMAVALAGYVAYRRWFYWLLALVVALPGGMLVNDLVKHLFHRERPHFDDPFLLLDTFSFPSGHVSGSTLFYGFVVALVMNRLPPNGSRVGIVVVAVMMVALVAISRMTLGVHYLSDVIGAFCESLAWLAIALTGVHAFRQARTRRGLMGNGGHTA
jgi:undecaprenyl-diphosphatase